MSRDWYAFKKGQDRVYDIIRSKRAQLYKHGTSTDTTWLARRGTFSVALLPSARIATHLASASHDLASHTSAVVYEREHLHTTLVSLPFQEHFLYREDDARQNNILRTLTRVAQSVVSEFGTTPCPIRYDSYLLGPEAVVAEGQPTERYEQLVSLLHARCADEGLPVKKCWGSHITMSRFTESRRPDDIESVLGLLDVLKSPVLSLSRQVAVGYSLWGSPTTRESVLEYNGHFKSFVRIPFRI